MRISRVVELYHAGLLKRRVLRFPQTLLQHPIIPYNANGDIKSGILAYWNVETGQRWFNWAMGDSLDSYEHRQRLAT